MLAFQAKRALSKPKQAPVQKAVAARAHISSTAHLLPKLEGSCKHPTDLCRHTVAEHQQDMRGVIEQQQGEKRASEVRKWVGHEGSQKQEHGQCPQQRQQRREKILDLPRRQGDGEAAAAASSSGKLKKVIASGARNNQQQQQTSEKIQKEPQEVDGKAAASAKISTGQIKKAAAADSREKEPPPPQQQQQERELAQEGQQGANLRAEAAAQPSTGSGADGDVSISGGPAASIAKCHSNTAGLGQRDVGQGAKAVVGRVQAEEPWQQGNDNHHQRPYGEVKEETQQKKGQLQGQQLDQGRQGEEHVEEGVQVQEGQHETCQQQPQQQEEEKGEESLWWQQQQLQEGKEGDPGAMYPGLPDSGVADEQSSVGSGRPGTSKQEGQGQQRVLGELRGRGNCTAGPQCSGCGYEPDVTSSSSSRHSRSHDGDICICSEVCNRELGLCGCEGKYCEGRLGQECSAQAVVGRASRGSSYGHERLGVRDIGSGQVVRGGEGAALETLARLWVDSCGVAAVQPHVSAGAAAAAAGGGAAPSAAVEGLGDGNPLEHMVHGVRLGQPCGELREVGQGQQQQQQQQHQEAEVERQELEKQLAVPSKEEAQHQENHQLIRGCGAEIMNGEQVGEDRVAVAVVGMECHLLECKEREQVIGAVVSSCGKRAAVHNALHVDRLVDWDGLLDACEESLDGPEEARAMSGWD